MVESSLVIVLLTALFLSVVQLGLAVHVRNTLLDAATEGARYAALADSNLNAGIARSAELIRSALGTGYTEDITGSVDATTVEIRVRAPVPLLATFGVGTGLDVRGHAVREIVD